METKRWLFIPALLFLFYTLGFSQGDITHFTPLLYKDATVLYFSNGISFDTRYGEPTLPKDLWVKDYGDENYYIVQLSGPIYQEDQENLKRTGAEIIDYLPNYAYIVRTNELIKKRLNAIPKVRWIGIFQPAYKLSPELKGEGKDTISILLFPGENRKRIAFRIEELDGIVIKELEDKGGDILRVVMDLSRIKELAHLKGVYWIEPYRTPRFFNNNAQWVMQDFYHHSTKVWSKGIQGEGQIGSVLDSGIRTTHNMFRDPAIPITTWGDYPNHRKIIAYQKADPNVTFGDEVSLDYHGTHTSCSVVGDDEPLGGTAPYDGIAKKAKVYFLDGGREGYGGVLVGNLGSNFAKAYNKGARVISNSWGVKSNIPTPYTSSARILDQFMWSHPDCLILFSQGNVLSGGYVYVNYTAAAKDVVAVGAVGNSVQSRQYRSWSCKGPTADGRYKPTIVAPGEVTSAYGTTDDEYVKYAGTSMSCPIAAGTALLIRQYFTEGWYPKGKKDTLNGFKPSAALIKAVLINSAENDIGGHTVPDNYVGWGRPNLDNTLYFEGDSKKLGVVDTIGLRTGEKYGCNVEVKNSASPLRVTLVWTDYPASTSSGKAIVNNLDLEVKSPAGKVYKGNVYSAGQSITGGNFDDINVEEDVRINAPTPGVWRVTVYGRNIPRGPQKFALVVSGEIPKGLGIEEEREEEIPYRVSITSPSYIPRIDYQIPERTFVNISVYNSLGEKVKELVNGVKNPGIHRIFWDGLDRDNQSQPAGVYFYKIEIKRFSRIHKAVLLH